MPEYCTIEQQQQGWHVAGNLPRLVWLCRDTYPNQHVGITTRALIYRWMDRDAAGVPQVPMDHSSGLLPLEAPVLIAGKHKLFFSFFPYLCMPLWCKSPSQGPFCMGQSRFANFLKKCFMTHALPGAFHQCFAGQPAF